MTFTEFGKPNWTAGAQALLLAASIIAPATPSQPDGTAIRLHKGYPFVNLTINNQPLNLLLDTGTTSIVLTEQAAMRANVKVGTREMLATTSGEVEVPASLGNTAQIGGQTMKNVEILIYNLPVVKQIHRKADGIVGFSVLAPFRILLDLKKKRLLIGEKAAIQGQYLPNKLPAMLRAGRVVVQVGLWSGEPEEELTLDTGAPQMVLSRLSSDARLLDGRIQLQTIHGFQSAARVAMDTIQVGDAFVFDEEALFVSPVQGFGQPAGVIPANWFSAIYFDDGIVRFSLKKKARKRMSILPPRRRIQAAHSRSPRE